MKVFICILYLTFVNCQKDFYPKLIITSLNNNATFTCVSNTSFFRWYWDYNNGGYNSVNDESFNGKFTVKNTYNDTIITSSLTILNVSSLDNCGYIFCNYYPDNNTFINDSPIDYSYGVLFVTTPSEDPICTSLCINNKLYLKCVVIYKHFENVLIQWFLNDTIDMDHTFSTIFKNNLISTRTYYAEYPLLCNSKNSLMVERTVNIQDVYKTDEYNLSIINSMDNYTLSTPCPFINAPKKYVINVTLTSDVCDLYVTN